jgi:hypothetical protein
VAGDFLGEGRDEAIAIDGDAKGGLNASEQFGDMQRGASLLEYVIGHVNLRPTFSWAECGGRFAMAKAADGAELSIERCFEYRENRILEIIRHGGS